MNIIYLLEDVDGIIQVGKKGFIYSQKCAKNICDYSSPYFGEVLKAYLDDYNEFYALKTEKELAYTEETGMNIIQILEQIRGDIDIKETTIAFFHDGKYYKTGIYNPCLGRILKAYLEGYRAFEEIIKNPMYMVDSY